MAGLRQRTVSSLQSVIGSDTWIGGEAREAVGRVRLNRIRADGYDKWVDLHQVVWRPSKPTDRRIGIFLAGGCDTPALYQMAPLIERSLDATVAMVRSGNITSNNPELLLQQLTPPAPAVVTEACARLKVDPSAFASGYFDRDFTVRGLRREGRFDKTVVVLSLGSAMIRTLYRHREHGYLVDPGGSWLDQDLDEVLEQRREVLSWFSENFASTGRPSPDRFKDAFKRLVAETRSRTGAEVLVLNTLVVEPGEPTHNYQLKRKPEALRRRAFHVAIAELGKELDVPVIDVDHVAKQHGVTSSVDFAHFPGDLEEPLAFEAHRILCARGVFR